MTRRHARQVALGAAAIEMELALVDASAARTEVACAVAGLMDALDTDTPDVEESPGD